MADDNRPDPQNMRRRRPPTVIDLPATEVPSASTAPEASVSPPSEPVQPTSSETPPPPPPESPRVEPEPPPGRRPPFAFLPEQLSWSQAGAAIAGLAGGLIVVLLLWLGGIFSSGRDPVVDLSPRLAAIEKQLNEL